MMASRDNVPVTKTTRTGSAPLPVQKVLLVKIAKESVIANGITQTVIPAPVRKFICNN